MCATKRKRLAALVMAFVMMAFVTPQQARAESNYFDENRIYVKTLVIVIDTLGVGEDNIWMEFERLRKINHDAGETFGMDDGDWNYFTEVPYGLTPPLSLEQPGNYRLFIEGYIAAISGEYKWQRIFIYEDNLSLEPKVFGFHDEYRRTLPDEVTANDMPFDVNFVINGLNYGDFGRRIQVGLHGEIHWMECFMNCIDYETAVQQFYHKFGESHCVLENYLNSIGVTPDNNYLIDSDFWRGTGIKAYYINILTPEQQDVYNAYLLQKMREEFDLLPYLWRFFNYSPEQAAD